VTPTPREKVQVQDEKPPHMTSLHAFLAMMDFQKYYFASFYSSMKHELRQIQQLLYIQ
jgi:hypothetical protein